MNILAMTYAQANFSDAASTYDANASQQQHALQQLLNLSHMHIKPHHVMLDAGCGTGALSRLSHHTNIVQLDKAEGMCRHAANQHPTIRGCLESLPLATKSIDIYASSLCWQWVQSLQDTYNEMRRVMRHGGIAILALLSEGSCQTLTDALAACSIALPRLHYPSMTILQTLLEQEGGKFLTAKQETYHESYKNTHEMLRHFQQIGATLTPQASQLSITQTKQLIEYYNAHFSTENGVFLPYNIAYFVVKYD